MERTYSVYLLRDPTDQQVRYVGCTSDVSKRIYDHILCGRHDRSASSSHKHKNWLHKLRKSKRVPLVEVVFSTQIKLLAFEMEMAYQRCHRDSILNTMVPPRKHNCSTIVGHSALAFAARKLRGLGRTIRGYERGYVYDDGIREFLRDVVQEMFEASTELKRLLLQETHKVRTIKLSPPPERRVSS